MDEHIYYLLQDLKDTLDNDPRIIRLNETEKTMNQNEEVMLLAYKKDLANSEYNDLLKAFKEDNEQVIASRKRLLDAKNKLESHPVVKEYLDAFKEVKMLLYEVNKTLFYDLLGE